MIRVDPLDEGLDGSVAGGEPGDDLLLALGPVFEVLAELGLRVEDDRTVTRIDRSRIALEHPSERGQVPREVAVRRVDEAGPAAEHGVPGEQGADPASEKTTWSAL